MIPDPTITVVVPTKDSARTLEACLRSVRAQTLDGVELIVVDNHSSDDTLRIARMYADKVIVEGPERSRQRNVGAAAGSGRYVCFLDSDLLLEPDVLAEAVTLLEGGPRAIVIPERAFGEGFWARCKGLEKQLYLGDESVEAARVFPRGAFLGLGGFDQEMTAREDWELADRMVAAGHTVGRVRSFANHDEGRARLSGTFAKKRYYGRVSASYASAQTTPHRRSEYLRASLFNQPKVLLRRPLVAVGLFAMKAVEAAGFVVGRLEARLRSRGSLLRPTT